MRFAITWIDLKGFMFSEISQTEKDKNCHVFTYMWNLKNKTNKYRKIETDSQIQRTY